MYFVFHIDYSLTIHTTNSPVKVYRASKVDNDITRSIVTRSIVTRSIVTRSIANIVETVSSVKTVSSSNVVKTLPDNRRKQG